MLDLVHKKLNESLCDKSQYLIIHCSAGCGRTGSLVAIDYCWNLLKKNQIKIDFKLIEIVKFLREQRMSLIEMLVRNIKALAIKKNSILFYRNNIQWFMKFY